MKEFFFPPVRTVEEWISRQKLVNELKEKKSNWSKQTLTHSSGWSGIFNWEGGTCRSCFIVIFTVHNLFNLFGDFSQLISSYHFIQVPYLACYNAFILFIDGFTDAISINLYLPYHPYLPPFHFLTILLLFCLRKKKCDRNHKSWWEILRIIGFKRFRLNYFYSWRQL